MRTWNLGANDPLFLTLAADTRLIQPSYTNDHIWQINLGEAKSPALSAETTYGLRARSMRLFPHFLYQGRDILSTSQFHQAPRLISFFPNYLSFSCIPFQGLHVQVEYWIPESQLITGRLVFNNQTDEQIDFLFEWISLLDPMPNGESMQCVSNGMIHILEGKTTNLVPVCVMTGGPEPGKGPYPALSKPCSLLRDETWHCRWALATLHDQEDSLALARQSTARNWEAETARIEMENQRQLIEITTGDPDWDACFALTQKAAYGLLLQHEGSLPNPSFVLNRLPDQGYAIRENGSDLPYSWSGQTALNAYYLTSLLLPGGVDLMKGILDNFFSVQTEQGHIDWKPGLGGQRSHQLAQPILAALALDIFEYTQDKIWLSSIYPGLMAFITTWFSTEHDRDQDGYPEWEHPLQTGLEDSPTYDYWGAESQGIAISALEAPSLAAFLYRECAALLQISKHIDQDKDQEWILARLEMLRLKLSESWNGREKIFRYRDFENHSTNKGLLLRSIKGKTETTFRRNFKYPQRLNFVFQFENETTRPITIQINGSNQIGTQTERIAANQLIWANGTARGTSTHLFTSLQKIEISGLYKNDACQILTADYAKEDVSLLLPIWAGALEPQLAKTLIEKKLLPHFLKKYGIPICPDRKNYAENTEKVSLIWNNLIGEGLLNYGYNKESARLVTRVMDAVIASLKVHHAFFQHYNAYQKKSMGERNNLEGFAPIGLFLKTLGLKKLSRDEIILEGLNPYPWPVTIEFQRIKIHFHKKGAVITFPTGQTAEVEGPGLHRIFLA